MIITQSWLNEYIDMGADDFGVVEATLNRIGHEVATVETVTIPAKVVVAKVLACEPHPDADKLSVCQVDIGPETVQIVCGARNVRADIYVAAAINGAELPGGMKIKPVQLRGVDSNGMLCSSTEIGLPKMNDGIMILDSSIGKLIVGKELREYACLADTVIEIELTANRGDCLSIHGIGRELCAANGYKARQPICNIDDDNAKGIGRVLQVDCASSVTASLMYKVVETEGIKSNFLTDVRTALVGAYEGSDIERVLAYATHATGVLLHAYDFEFFYDESIKKADIKVIKDEGLNRIKTNTKTKASLVGIRHVKEAMATTESKMIIIEAAHVDPDEIAKEVYEQRIETDEQYYRASRGSEPDLELGLCQLCETIGKQSKAIFYSEKIQHRPHLQKPVIHCRVDEVSALVGRTFEKIEINNILKRLGMEVKAAPEQNTLMVSAPAFRHDLYNSADIIEEIVRIVGIDNIEAKPLAMAERDIVNEDYARYRAQYDMMQRSVAQGFVQAMHFVFEHSANQTKYGLPVIDADKALLNPITAELDTLRTSLIPGLLASVQRNVYKSRNRVALFEVGSCFNPDRSEYKVAAFAWSGESEADDVTNHGKPAAIELHAFLQKIKAILPGCEFGAMSHTAGYVHPGMSGDILLGGKSVGFVSKLHPMVAREMDLPATFIAQINLDDLPLTLKTAVATSKYQRSQRDLSVVVDQSLAFTAIKKTIDALSITELKEFYPADFYYDAKMGEKFSLTLRFSLQALEHEVSEERSNEVMESILAALQADHGAVLR